MGNKSSITISGHTGAELLNLFPNLPDRLSTGFIINVTESDGWYSPVQVVYDFRRVNTHIYYLVTYKLNWCQPMGYFSQFDLHDTRNGSVKIDLFDSRQEALDQYQLKANQITPLIEKHVPVVLARLIMEF